MRRRPARLAVLVGALALTGAGLLGALSYGRDYNLHRGFETVVQFRRAGRGRLLAMRFYSPALRRRADYLVYLPPHYRATRRYPVYYLLHGMPGQPRVFVDIANMDVRLDDQLSEGHVRPMILVYPDGRIGGSVFSDSEWANSAAGGYASYVVDVMHDVDRHFATLPHRRDRVIGGFSAGAYGAVNIALQHVADFASVQSWSGYFTQTRSGVFAHASHATLAANSPLDELRHLTARLGKNPLRADLFVGRDDSASTQQLPMVRALRAHGARVRYRFYPGGHDWSVWYPRLNEMLILASWDISHPPRRPVVPRRRAARTAAGGLRHTIVTERQTRALMRDPPIFAGHHRHRHRHRRVWLVGALLLALISAALINLGFVLQHRGRRQDLAAGRSSLRYAFANRSWLGGQALGWVGFGSQIVAVALAPLTLVQAFAAGSLAISVPVAARVAGQRIGRVQLGAAAGVAVSLASLPVGFGGQHGHLEPGSLLMACGAVAVVALALGLRGRTAPLAVASGCLYGVADAAIKADSLGLRIHGAAALASDWTVIAALGTFGGFLCFQGALRGRDAVQPLSLMNAFTAVTALGLGVGGFGESLGSSTPASLAHVVAIALVLVCVRPLTQAQEELIHADDPAATVARSPHRAPARAVPDRRRRTLVQLLRASAASLATTLAVSMAVAAGTGLLYALRQLHWLAVGPSVPDALPLLQLAGFSGQPLLRVVVAWLAIGGVIGLALMRISPSRRVPLIAVPSAVLLLFASEASYALTRNLGLQDVLVHRAPGLGPLVQALLLGAGGALARSPAAGRRATAPPLVAGSSTASASVSLGPA